MTTIEEFQKDREKLNDLVLDFGGKSIKRFYNLDNQVYQEGALYCFWMVLVFGNPGASNPDCADRRSSHGGPVCLCAPYWNIHHCGLGIARAYGKVAI